MTAIATDREQQHALNVEAQTRALADELDARTRETAEAQQQFCQLANEALSVQARARALKAQLAQLEKKELKLTQKMGDIYWNRSDYGVVPESGVIEIDGQDWRYVVDLDVADDRPQVTFNETTVFRLDTEENSAATPEFLSVIVEDDDQ